MYADFISNPWDERRADLRIGILAAHLMAALSPRGGTFRISDYMPNYDPPRPAQTEQQQKRVARSIFSMIDKLAAKKHGQATQKQADS